MKFLCRFEKDRITVYKMKKGPRQMISVSSRLYTVTDDLAIKDIESDEAMYFYDIDSTQPKCGWEVFVNPDMTRALIRSAQLGGNKKRSWASLDANKALQWIAPVAIVGSLLYGFMIGGGF